MPSTLSDDSRNSGDIIAETSGLSSLSVKIGGSISSHDLESGCSEESHNFEGLKNCCSIGLFDSADSNFISSQTSYDSAEDVRS